MPQENVVLRKILAVVGGFALWSILWLLLGQSLAASGMLAPPGQPVTASLPLLVLLVGSVAFSLLAGYAAAAIARRRTFRVAVVLGVVLLGVGIAVQAQYWQLMPLWYHAAFLACLLPACVAGARLRSPRTAG